jgi:Tfp pilus assembly protein PilN
MAEFDLNLSTQPFPAYRLTTIALICLLLVLGVVSVWQARGFIRYSNMARAISAEEQESRIEAEALAKRVGELESRLDRPESAAKLNEIGFLNRLILRKELSWTRLVGVLEDMVPDNVHLTSLAPDIGGDGAVTLRLQVRARSIGDVTEFVNRVETSPLFEYVSVTVEEKKDPKARTDVDVTLSAVYHPPGDAR